MRVFLIGIMALMSLICCAKTEKYSENQLIKMENQTNDEAEILALTRKFTQLMIERDTKTLNKILDEGFTLTHITGYVQPKNEWFKEIETESMKYYSAKEVQHSIKINGNKAEFVQQNLLDARIWGTRNVWRLQQTMSLEKRNGEWVILKSVAKIF